MLKYAADINATVKGLGAIVDNQNSVIRFLIKNWPVTGIAAMALAGQLHRRWKKKDLSPFTVMSDTGMILTPVVALFTIQQMAKQDKAEAKVVKGLLQASAAPPAARPPQAVPNAGSMKTMPVASSIQEMANAQQAQPIQIVNKIA